MHTLTVHITYTFYVKRLRSIAVEHKKVFGSILKRTFLQMLSNIRNFPRDI